MQGTDLKAHAAQCATKYLATLYEERQQPATAIGLEFQALRISDEPLRHEYLHAFLDTLATGIDGDDPFIMGGKFADRPDEHAAARIYFRSGTHNGHAATVRSHCPAYSQTATLSVGCFCGAMSSDLDAKPKDRELARLARSARHLAAVDPS